MGGRDDIEARDERMYVSGGESEVMVWHLLKVGSFTRHPGCGRCTVILLY